MAGAWVVRAGWVSRGRLEITDRPVVDSNLLIGIRNALLVDPGSRSLIVLLYWLF